MDILGSIGHLYTFILLVALFLGSGLAVWAGMNAVINKSNEIKESTNKIKTNLNSKLNDIKNNKIIGGINMKNSGFIKLAVFSFIGIIISAAILTALPNYNNNAMGNMNMNSQYNTSSMNMNGMYNQSNMQGMSNYSTQGTMGSADLTTIQQQLNYMQQQIYQLQNQMNSMSNSGSSMNGNSMNNNSMNSNSMNSNSNSNSNSNNGSSSSMSSMPMM